MESYNLQNHIHSDGNRFKTNTPSNEECRVEPAVRLRHKALCFERRTLFRVLIMHVFLNRLPQIGSVLQEQEVPPGVHNWIARRPYLSNQDL